MIRSFDFQRHVANSRFSNIHPLTKIITISVLTFFLILLQNVFTLIMLNLLCFILLIISGLPWNQLKIAFILIFFTLYGVVFSQSFFYDIYPLTTWLDFGTIQIGSITILLRFTYEGMEHGLLVALRIVAPLILTYIIFFTSSPDSFLVAFKQLGINQTFNIMIITAIRFIPQIIQDYKTIRINQKLLRRSVSIRKPVMYLNHEFKMIKPLFFIALRRSNELAYSILGRSFNQKKRNQHDELSLPFSERLYIIFLLCMAFVLIVIKILFQLHLFQLFTSPGLRIIYEVNRYYLLI